LAALAYDLEDRPVSVLEVSEVLRKFRKVALQAMEFVVSDGTDSEAINIISNLGTFEFDELPEP
jgi:hypothetical protein